MKDVQHTKSRIQNLVKGYKELFPNEYTMVVEAVEMQRRLQKDEFASVQHEGVIGRALIEWPEKLHSMIYDTLDSEELEYFISKECIRWFAKTFPEFALAEKI